VGTDSREIDNIQCMSKEALVCNGWRIDGIGSAGKFFSALPEILALPVTLCFEGTKIAPDIQALFASNAVAPSLQIPPGTIWPKPSVFHVLGTEQFLLQLMALAGKHAGAEVCDHFHAYKDHHGLLQWYDAFSGDPVLLDESIREEALQSFCRRLGAQYASWHAKKQSKNSADC